MEAALNAPASITPSSAMLMTPERSENIPPSAARMSGVASLMDEKRRLTLNMSFISCYFVDGSLLFLPQPGTGLKKLYAYRLMLLNLRPLQKSEPAERAPEERLRGDEEDDDALKDLHKVFRDVLAEGVNGDASALEHREEKRREEN